MRRSLLLFSALLGACTVGEVPGGGGGDGGGGNADRNACAQRAATPATAYEHSGGAGTRAGLACMDAGCHLIGNAGGSEFAFAGTVYKEIGGTTPAAGVTVRMYKPGSDVSLASAVTDSAGNFHIANANYTDFPYETQVTGCGSSPDIHPMNGQITSAQTANCSSGGTCHGVPTPGGNAIYMPD